MRRITIGIIVFSVLIIGWLAFLFYVKSVQPNLSIITVGPCHGYAKVGEFDQKIDSENEAKQIALDYYSSIGYKFQLENLTARKIDNVWYVGFDFPKVSIRNLCVESANPPECIGQELKLEEKLLGKNRILMEYQIPC